MVNFGFQLNTSSRVNLDKFDKQKYDRLIKAEPDVRICMACGTCTSTCAAGKFTKTSLRKAILLLQNGDEKGAVENLKGCMLCGKCTLVCPRGINTRNLINNILKIYNK